MNNKLHETKGTIEVRAVCSLYEIYISLLKEEKFQLSNIIEDALYELENELNAELSEQHSDEIENIFKQFQIISSFFDLPESSRKRFINSICSSTEEAKSLCRFE